MSIYKSEGWKIRQRLQIFHWYTWVCLAVRWGIWQLTTNSIETHFTGLDAETWFYFNGHFVAFTIVLSHSAESRRMTGTAFQRFSDLYLVQKSPWQTQKLDPATPAYHKEHRVHKAVLFVHFSGHTFPFHPQNKSFYSIINSITYIDGLRLPFECQTFDRLSNFSIERKGKSM